MKFQKVSIGMALTGSHCTISSIFPQLKKLKEAGALIYPVISPAVNRTSTRFGEAAKVKEELNKYTGERIIKTIVQAEPAGPEKMFDLYVIAPCTGNTLAKLAGGITDTSVLMGAKAQLRNQRPVLLAIATNDGLGLNARNIGLLLSTKNIFFVPFGQDAPLHKPNSLVSSMELLLPAMEKALQKEQLQPVLLSYTEATE